MKDDINTEQEETLDPEDWEAMRLLGHRMVDDALEHMRTLRERPVWQHAPEPVKAQFGGPPPTAPASAAAVYDTFLTQVRPYQFGNQHPRFWGWVVGTGTVMSIFAEMLAASMNAISGSFSFLSNNYVEWQVIHWCKTLLGYPEGASGLITSGCSASNLIGLTVARNVKAGFDVRKQGIQGLRHPLVLYCSEEGHSSLQKAVEMLGLGNDALRRIPVNAALQMDIAALKSAIQDDRDGGYQPFCVVGVAGTTTTGAMDDLGGIAAVCREEDLWFHVDGAFGAWAALSSDHKHLVAGMEQADSLAFDLHKWMYLAYPIGCILVKDAEAHRNAFSLTPAYLAHGEGVRGLTAVDVPWLSDLGFELSRGFQALKAWMTINEQGTAKFSRLIQQNIEQAQYLARQVGAAPELELALPVSLNVVCFRYVHPGLQEVELDRLNKQIDVELQEQGLAVVSMVSIRTRQFLHVAITNHRSRRSDFDLLVREVIRIGDQVLAVQTPAE